MRAPPLLLTLALAACGDPRCPPGTAWVDGRDAGWCATAAGVREGPYEERDGDVVIVEARYHSGALDGPWTRRWPDGAPREEGAYAGGAPIGWWRRWTEAGEALPDTLRGTVAALAEVGPVAAVPDPGVRAATWLGPAVGTPRLADELVLVPLTTGISAVDAASGAVHWEAPSPDPVRSRELGGGVRTAAVWTEPGDALVVWLEANPPTWQVLRLGARPDPAPRANDFGLVWVDAAGELRDTPLDARVRPQPGLGGVTAVELAGERVIAGTIAGELLHWQRLEERERWRVDLGAPVRAVLAPDWTTTYALAGAELVALGFGDGSVSWRVPVALGEGARLGLAGARVWAADSSGALLAFDAATGAPAEVPPGEGALVGWERLGLTRFDGLALRVDGAAPLALAATPYAPPLLSAEGAWVGTRDGLLLAVQPLRAGPPAITRAPGLARVDARAGGRPVELGGLVAFADAPAGVRRVALHLGEWRGAPLDLDALFVDLPDGPRAWAEGWTVEEHPGLAWPVPGGALVAPGRPGEAVEDGLVAVRGADGALRAAALTVDGPEWVVHVDGVELARLPGPVAPAPARLTRARWSGRRLAPWVEAFTEAPPGYLGWDPPPAAPAPPPGEAQEAP